MLACGAAAKRSEVPFAPLKVATRGSELLVLLPAGAEAVAELDLARLRANQRFGPILGAAAAGPRGARLAAFLGFDLFTQADTVVAAVYGLGSANARILVLTRGDGLGATATADREGVSAIDSGTVAFGPDELRDEVLSRVGGKDRCMRDEERFMRLRDAAMPTRAQGALLRAAAILSPAARVGFAGRLGVDEMPATVSLWLDAADDLAMIALFGLDDAAAAGRAARTLQALWTRAWGRLGVGGMTIESVGEVVRAKWVVGPRALAAWLDRLASPAGEAAP